jgi:hypothetical protein
MMNEKYLVFRANPPKLLTDIKRLNRQKTSAFPMNLQPPRAHE